jgi:hypothetical protein
LTISVHGGAFNIGGSHLEEDGKMITLERRQFPHGEMYRIMEDGGSWFSVKSMRNRLPSGSFSVFENDVRVALWRQTVRYMDGYRTPWRNSRIEEITIGQQVRRETKELFAD